MTVSKTFATATLLAPIFLLAPLSLAMAASCDALHPCPSGQACNEAGTCVAVPTGGTSVQSGGGLDNPLGTTSLSQLITDILQLVVQIGAVVIVFMLVYVGFLFVVAQGSESKLEEAKRALLWTIIGALILLGAEAIAQGLQATVSALSG